MVPRLEEFCPQDHLPAGKETSPDNSEMVSLDKALFGHVFVYLARDIPWNTKQLMLDLKV